MRRSPVSILVGLLLPLSLLAPTDLAHAAVSASTIDSAAPLLTGWPADGRIGDLILENDQVAFIISALGHVTHYGENGGTVIDAGSSVDRIDGLGELYPWLEDDWPRQAVYHTLTILNDGSTGGPAVIEALGVDSQNAAIQVVTEYRLQDGARHLSIVSWVSNTGASNYPAFELGDAFEWGNCTDYAPGYGYDLSGTTTEPWIAGVVAGVSYGFVGAHGDLWGPNGNQWSDVNVTSVALGPGATRSYTRHLVVGDGSLVSVAQTIHELAGTPTGTVFVTVTDASTGSALSGATVEAYDASDLLYLPMSTDAGGLASSTLPAGSWRLEARALGYFPNEQSLTVIEGQSYGLGLALTPDGSGGSSIGDTLTVIQRPLLNLPSFALPGGTLEISCDAPPTTTGWTVELRRGGLAFPMELLTASHDPSTLWWTLQCRLPDPLLREQYDLRVTADGGLDDTSRKAVRVIDSYPQDYYFVHITDTHLPDHRFSDSGGAPEDSTESVDLRAVIQDLNIIQPAFVLLTGDLVNEGELEDYLDWRCYSRAQGQLREFDVPVFLIAGNHDIGGWESTPPPDGTARRDWWRFFGWKRLDTPPPGAPWYTQNYSFDFGDVHYTALESYNNYDMWRSWIYGSDSFTDGQLDWLGQDLTAASESGAQVLFYHYDFQDQLNLGALGVEMALSGHTHGDRGSLSSMPYDLGTAAVCDGNRTYRLIRVSGNTLLPQATLSAGSSGQNLRVSWAPANDGTNPVVTAQITNQHDQRFEHAQLRFHMPKGTSSVAVTGGSIDQVDAAGEIAVYYVSVDILPSGTQSVTLSLNPDAAPDLPRASALRLGQNVPNPFNPSTEFAYSLPEAGPVRLAVFDLSGREIALLRTGWQAAGDHTASWNGRDHLGRAVSSGTYLLRLSTRGGERTRKIVLLR